MKTEEKIPGPAELLLQQKQQEYKSLHGRFFEASNEYDSARKLFWLGIASIIVGTALLHSLDYLNYYYFLGAGILQTLITFPCIGGLQKISMLQTGLNVLKTDLESCGMRICCSESASGHNLEIHRIDAIPDGIHVLEPHVPIDFVAYKNTFKWS